MKQYLENKKTYKVTYYGNITVSSSFPRTAKIETCVNQFSQGLREHDLYNTLRTCNDYITKVNDVWSPCTSDYEIFESDDTCDPEDNEHIIEVTTGLTWEVVVQAYTKEEAYKNALDKLDEQKIFNCEGMTFYRRDRAELHCTHFEVLMHRQDEDSEWDPKAIII
jgi:hypothetical protein